MNKLFLKTTFLLTALLLSGCNSQTEPVAIQPTQEISTPETTDITSTDFEEIPEISDGVDSKTNESASINNESTAYISESEAKEIALLHANVNEVDANFLKVKLDYDNGIAEFEVEFYVDNMEYDYEINAITGEILSYDHETETSRGNLQIPSTTTSDELISEIQAKEIAFQHADLSESDVTRLKVEFDYDDGIPEYEIEFYVQNIEYDYEINAITGDILSFGKEINN